MERTRTTNAIPETLAPFFQEYRLPDLDLDRDASTVIERTLRYGNRQELRWLFGAYPESVIAEWVRRSGPCRLPPSHRAFWRQVLRLDHD